MKISLFLAYLFSATSVLAQEAETAPQQMQQGSSMILMFAIVFAIFYLLVLRPQANELKEHQKFIDAMKRGDEVVTDSGLIGKVAGIEKNYVLLEVASGVKVKVETSHIVKSFDNSKE